MTVPYDENMLLDLARGILAMGKASSEGMKHDLPSGFTTHTNLNHGPSGIFGAAGIDQNVFGTRVRPRGLMNVLPAFPSVDTNPIVAYLTGFTDSESGSEKDAPCDDPLQGGDMKSCLQGALFGRIERKTKPIELNKIGERTNRGEMYDLRLVNDPLLESSFAVTPGFPKAAMDVLNRQVLSEWLKLGVAFERAIGPLVYTGNPSNNTNGGYAEWHGLETLVGTGKIDVITANVCTALDSDVVDWAYKRVEDFASDFFELIVDMYRYLSDIASRTGLDPVEFVIVMRRDLFNVLADLWPCAYATYRCNVQNVQDSNLDRVMVDGMAQRQMSDDIRRGEYLLIDGVRVRVVLDDFIPETSNTDDANVTSGNFASDVYILPLTVRGGIVSTFFEYFDYSAPNGVLQAIRDGLVMNEYWTDGGRYLWTTQRTLWCLDWAAKIEPRLRLLTPHLAGRIQDVQYGSRKHRRDDSPDSGYHFDGGVTTRSNAPYDSSDFA